jgi:hypothetical protein
MHFKIQRKRRFIVWGLQRLNWDLKWMLAGVILSNAFFQYIERGITSIICDVGNVWHEIS